MSVTPSRRHVLKAGAWSVPAVVLASAAPAYATSQASGAMPMPAPAPAPMPKCVNHPHLLTWSTAALAGSGGPRTAVARAIAPVPSGSKVEDVRVTLVSAFEGSMRALSGTSGTNMTVSKDRVGGLGAPGLMLYQENSSSRARTRAGDRHLDAQVLQVVFDRQVSNLSFTVTDIDSTAGQFADRVSITGGTFAATPARGVSGSGTAAAPWVGPSGNVEPGQGQGNVKVTFTQPVSAFTLRFWNAEAGAVWWFNQLRQKGAQGIFLSDFSFAANTCA